MEMNNSKTKYKFVIPMKSNKKSSFHFNQKPKNLSEVEYRLFDNMFHMSQNIR